MARIYLHIGQPKTGSTALQSFCAKNRDALFAKGIGYYAPLHRYDPWGGESNADFLLVLAARRAGIALKDYYTESKWEKQGVCFGKWLSEETAAFSAYARSVENLILSEEWLWSWGVRNKAFWVAVREELKMLCPDATVDIICYLRRQDEWLLSKWKEDMQNEIPVPLNLVESMDSYETEGFLDYEAILRRLEEVFGKEHLFVRPYDLRRFPRGSIIEDFMQMMGLAKEAAFLSAADKAVGYDSIPYDVALVLCQLNKKGRIRQKDRFCLYRAARAVVAEKRSLIGNRLPEPERKLLSEMFERYAEGNRRIAERYAGAEALFSEDAMNGSEGTEPKRGASLSQLKRRIIRAMMHIRFKERKAARVTETEKKECDKTCLDIEEDEVMKLYKNT